MRRRLVISTIAIVLVVLGALAVPVGQVVYNAAERQLDARLDQQASKIADAVSTATTSGQVVDAELIADVLGPRDGVRITGPDGNEILNYDPADLDSPRQTFRRTSDGSMIFVSTDTDPLDERFRDQVNILLLLVLGAIAAAAALAAVQAHQLAQPLERLAKRAARIGDGDFSRSPEPPTQIPEIDRIGDGLETSSRRVEEMLANERHFTADATHQLRTGLTGIAMRLEILAMNSDDGVSTEARAGLSQTEQLNATIDELLAVARSRSTRERTEFDLVTISRDHVNEWRPRFQAEKRTIALRVASPAPPVYGTKGLAGQILDVMIDNALVHGDGAVEVIVEGPAVTLTDQGPGIEPERVKHVFDGPVDPSAKHGRGLPLARRLAQVDGASLDLIGNRPFMIRYRLVRSDHVTSESAI